MMRLNAPITAILALAVLSFLSLPCLARAIPHRAHKKITAEQVAQRKVHMARHERVVRTERDVRSSKGHRVKSAVLARVNAHKEGHKTGGRRGRHLAKVSAPEAPRSAQTERVDDAAAQKATSADFLKAASSSLEAQPAVAIHGASRPEEVEANRQAPRTSRHNRISVAKPVAVVSVIRRSAEKPQLNSVQEVASTPMILPALYNKRGHLIVPPPLKGSHEILLHQNQVADRDGLLRIQNDEDLVEMRNQRLLVALPTGGGLEVDERLPVNRRYCRFWTSQFLIALGRAHYAQFHTPLQVNSAVRTVEFQQHLQHINGNAAPAEGDTASPHLTGQAVDIAKHGLSLTEIAWMRGYLLPLVQEGKVDVEEEFQQSCFHISVYKRYLPAVTSPGRTLALSRHSETSALATAMR